MVFFAYLVLGLFVFVFGSCIGSFLNVVIYRVPRKLNIAKGRSFCPHCRQTLRPWDMIPVLSWFLLHGKCRFCHEKIPVRYPIVEALGGICAFICVLCFGFSLKALVIFAATMVLIAIALIDADTLEIPNGLILALMAAALAAIWVFPQPGVIARLIGAATVSLPMFLLNLVLKDSFGGGDIKLMVVCGFLLGWQQMLVGSFLALLLAGGYGAYLLLRHKKGRKDHIAFGPFISLGMVSALFFGRQILQFYLSLFW